MTNPTPREIQLVEAAIKAASQECNRTMMFPGGRQESYAHHGVDAAATAIRSLDPAAIVASVPKSQDAQSDGELHFNATRLRNVARLVGLESAVPQDDETLDGARGSVLGMIAGALRNKARAALSAQEQVEPTDAQMLIWAKYILRHPEKDHACEECGGSMVVSGFRCAFHDARALLSANQGK